MKTLFKPLFRSENYLYRLYALTALLIVGGVLTHNALQYSAINSEVNQIAYREAKLLVGYYHSVSHVYEQQLIDSGMEMSGETIELLPVHSASRIGDDFKKHTSRGVLIRSVSDQVRNPRNIPTAYERDAIAHFKRDPRATELARSLTLGGQDVLFYASPIKIEPYCLMCHGKREEAPSFIRDGYSTGYDYQVGDVRGVISITVQKNTLLKNVQEKYKLYFLYSALIALTLLILIFVIVRRSVRIEEALLRNLKHMSFLDPLTDLFNRRKVNKYIDEHHSLFERYGDTYSVIMIDIDHFKSINDTYGHNVGDTVLKELAKVLRDSVRHTDHAARWGGEEFLILCPKTTLEHAAILAEMLREKVAAHPFETLVCITASFGVAEVRPGDTIDTLIQRADVALYAAKESGRNRVSIAEK